MDKLQVVIIEGEYGLDIYHDKAEVDVLHIDLTPFNDSYPDKWQQQDIKAAIKKVRFPEAVAYLNEWYQENYHDWDEEERQASERIKAKKDIELNEAIEKVKSAGYEVNK